MEHIKPNKRYLLAQDEDLNLNISLKQNLSDVNEFNNTRVISLADLFTKERNDSKNYRIYGNINYVSFLRNKKTMPTEIVDMFNDDYLTTGFNFEDYFDIKLFRLTDIQISKTATTNPNTSISATSYFYTELLTAITDDNSFKLSYFGFSRNIYNEKLYNFKFDNINVDPNKLVRLGNDFIYDNNVYLGFIPKNMTTYEAYEKVLSTDYYLNELHPNTIFGFSITGMTLNIANTIINGTNYNAAEFRKYFYDKLISCLSYYNIKITSDNINKNLRFIRNYLNMGNGDYNQKVLLDTTKPTLSGNTIEFDKTNYLFNESVKKEYILQLTLEDTYVQNTPSDLSFQDYQNLYYSSFTYTVVNNTIKVDFSFVYNPFHKIELKKYLNTNDVTFDNTLSFVTPPENAIYDNNRYVWRDLMVYGDPNNYDLPFINNKHYYFNDINLYLKPNLSDKNTVSLLNDFATNFEVRNFKLNRANIKIAPKRKTIC